MAKGKFSGHSRLVRGFVNAGLHPFSRRKLFDVVTHVVPIDRVPAVGTFSKPEIVAAIKVPFTNVRGMKPMVFQTAANSLHIVAQSLVVGPYTIKVRPGARENG